MSKKSKTSSTSKYDHPGQPSKYKQEYCELLVAHMQGGGSYEGFGATINVCKQTLYTWEKTFPEFMDAKRRGKSKHRHYMDAIGHKMMTGEFKGAQAVWVFLMKNIHGLKDDPMDEDSVFQGIIFDHSEEE